MSEQLITAGIVLAGGASRRFGSPKALAQLHGKPFIAVSIEMLSAVTDSVIVITREELIQDIKHIDSSSVKEALIITDVDRFKEKGPLAGIYSAMIRKKADFYLVVPCDMPLMVSDMYQKWLEFAISHEYDCVIPVVNGKVYPLNGIYKHTCLREIFLSLSSKSYKVMEVLDRVNTFYMEVEKKDEKFFINVNTKKQLNLL
ncbi:molybdenum cofactor guanylyltransferase [Bacillus sp. NEB1478]|uniref:molybdenum cofactor guanylyltransferase n=1 Tax=Bacillus sp. NEB1478 TaxID=3073816 RepID=UPI0028732DCD|nr:molybdenum cofactor guanylyltransferase [Bacillus sp. NEB1478]WNB93540.1 molybdenum cofactor guanylyltransferase [Bacillus sp. NEB1478]